MSFKRNMIVGIATLLTFGACFITVRSCNAADPVQQTPATANEKSEDQKKAEAALLEGAVKDLKDLVKAHDEAKTLSEKIKLAQQVNNLQGLIDMLTTKPETETPAEKPAPVSYVQKAGQEFSDLVPVYAGNEVERPSGFGTTYGQAMSLAEAERPEVAAVKTAVINRLQEAHTKAVLDQDSLHIPEYSQLLKQAPRNDVVLETIQQERLKDEQAVEKLARPSFWQTVKWWWKS
jgi:hypothetical protein